MDTHAARHRAVRGLRSAWASILVGAVVACGGDSGVVVIPAPIGHLVVFTADTDWSNTRNAADEVWVADTGSATKTIIRIDRGVAAGDHISRPFAVGATGHLGYWVTNQTTFNDELRVLPRNGGATQTYLQDIYYYFKSRVNSTGQRLAVLNELNPTGPVFKVRLTDPQFTTIVDVNEGRAINIEFSGDGNVLYWQDRDANGTYSVISADVSGPLTTINRLTATQSIGLNNNYEMLPNRDGSAVVYSRVGFDGLWIAARDGSSDIRLTTQLTGGDVVFHAEMSPGGNFVLYSLNPSGPVQSQLWFAPLAAPLSEQRVDSASVPNPWLGQGYVPYAISPDGARFAWVGDTGSGPQIFVANSVAPTVSAPITPSSYRVDQLSWIDATTIVYRSDGVQLHTVSVNAPLVVVPHGAGGINSIYTQYTTCSDGTLVYSVQDGFWYNPGNVAKLMKATPLVPNSEVEIAPTIIDKQRPFSEIACVD